MEKEDIFWVFTLKWLNKKTVSGKITVVVTLIFPSMVLSVASPVQVSLLYAIHTWCAARWREGTLPNTFNIHHVISFLWQLGKLQMTTLSFRANDLDQGSMAARRAWLDHQSPWSFPLYSPRESSLILLPHVANFFGWLRSFENLLVSSSNSLQKFFFGCPYVLWILEFSQNPF